MSRIFSADDSVNPREEQSRWQRNKVNPKEIFPAHLEGKVDLTAFITGLRPIEIVAALPSLPDASYPEGSVVFLSTDGKLYRNVSDAWSKEVDGADLKALSVTTDSLVAGAVTAAKISVTQLDAISAAMGTLTSGIIQNASASPTKAIVFSGAVPGTADSFIDFTVGTGAGEIFMQVNSERLRIFGDGSITTHGIIKGYKLQTESGEGTAGGAAYLTGAAVLGLGAYLQTHKGSTTTIQGSDDVDMVELESGSAYLRGASGTWGLSLMAILGDYSVSTATLTQYSDTWASGDDPDGTADGKNILTFSINGTQTVTAANRLAIPLVLGSNPAYDSQYTLKFKIHHDCTNYTEPPLQVPDGDSLVSTVTIEANVNAAGYTNVGSAVFSGLVDASTTELEFTKTVDIGNTSPTSVSFRLKLSTTMQIDPDNLGGNIVTHVRVYNTTGIGTDPYTITWDDTAGSVQNRRGLQLFGVDNTTDVVPMVNLDKESFTATPSSGAGVEGDLIYVSGAVKKLAYHDGSAWATLETFSGNADTVDSLHAAAFVYVDGTNPLTANWDVGAFTVTALRFVSDQATGTAPFSVASTTLVTNLNADLLDGQEGSYYRNAGNLNAGTLLDARVAQSNVTQHQAALTILESQITDGSVLARVAGTETISGSWTFSAQPTLNYSDALSSKVAGYTIQSGAPAAEDYPEGTLWLDTSAVTPYNLDDLGDVTITSPPTGSLLMYNGSAWVDERTLTATSYTITPPSGNPATFSLASVGTNVSAHLTIQSSGGTGTPSLNFRGRALAAFTFDDTSDMVYSFYSAFSAARTYDAEIRIHGSAASSWNTYLRLRHDGSNAYISTDVGAVKIGTGNELIIEGAGNSGNTHFGRSDHAYISYPSTGDVIFRTFNGSSYLQTALIEGDGRAWFGKSGLGGAHVGPWVGGNTYAAFHHDNLIGTSNAYALLVASNGDTFLNAASGQTLFFRINNSTVASFTSSLLSLSTKTNVSAALYHTYVDKGGKSGNFTIDWSQSNTQYVTLANSTTATVTFSNITVGQTLILVVRRSSSTGGLTWPSSVDWGTTGAPTVPTTAGQAIMCLFFAHTATEVVGAVVAEGGFTLADF